MILYALLARSGSRLASVVIGCIVILTGVYFLLRNAFGLAVPPIDWDLVWPVVVIASGIAIVSKGAAPDPARHAGEGPEVGRNPEQERSLQAARERRPETVS